MTLATDQDAGQSGLSPKGLLFVALRDGIMARWEREIRARVDGADELLSPILTNALPPFLDNIAEALSPGYPRDDATSNNNAAAAHGNERARMTPFGPDQVVHEYQILRESIALEARGVVDLTEDDWAVIDRSIDSAVREAVREFAAKQDDLRRKLAAVLSHDIRTPLSVIANGAELIHRAPDSALARNAASKISSNARRLEKMMIELLDALTMKVSDKLPLSLSEFDVAGMLAEICADYRHIRPGSPSLQAEKALGHWCRHALRRAVENLINNAIKYGDGGPISILCAQERGRLMLSVHNGGQPIAKERHREIFDYYNRGQHDAAGWGLGLPFVKKVAESHGGSVTVDSSLETGTTFMIDIPIDCRPYVDEAVAATLAEPLA